MNKKHIIILALSAAAVLVVALVAIITLQRQSLHHTEPFRVNITPATTYSQLVDSLDAHNAISNHAAFGTIARLLHIPDRMHPGSYLLQPNTSALIALRRIAIGNQDPVRITINKHRTIPQLCQFLGRKLMLSADTLESLLTSDTLCARYGLTPATIFCLFPQNTYEFYWTISPRALLDRMQKERDTYWQSRQSQLQALGLTLQQVVTLASIVEEETNANDEKPLIASVYLNRYRIGMPLQADPTVKYAVGDFTIRRIRGAMLNIDNPYNTYKNQGLPPGPICIPSTSSIDAVLKNQKTDYLYFCAKEDFSGRHNFSSTISQHQANAQKFHKALNERKIN